MRAYFECIFCLFVFLILLLLLLLLLILPFSLSLLGHVHVEDPINRYRMFALQRARRPTAPASWLFWRLSSYVPTSTLARDGLIQLLCAFSRPPARTSWTGMRTLMSGSSNALTVPAGRQPRLREPLEMR